MTDTQWTSEPWRPGASRGRVASGPVDSSDFAGRYLTLADIVRACACVNACKGIPTAALKAGIVRDIVCDAIELVKDVQCYVPIVETAVKGKLAICSTSAAKLFDTLEGSSK